MELPFNSASKWSQINHIVERKYKIMHAAQNKTIVFYVSVESTQDSSSKFVFSRARHFPFSLFLCSICKLFKRISPLFFLTHISQAFLFIHSYKASHCKALVRVFLLLARRSSGDRGYCLLSCHFCCFYFIILYLFFCCRTPRRWVNPSEWNHNAPHFRNIHRGWLILRIFSHHLRLVLLISVNL